MTDAYDSLRADLESARATVETALTEVCTVERAAWSVYKDSGYLLEHRSAWRAAHEAAGQISPVLEQLDRVGNATPVAAS